MKRLLLLLALLTPEAPALAGPPDTAGLGFVQKPGAQLPLETAVTGMDGQKATLGAMISGRPALLVLGYYTCPGLCGLIRNDIFSALANTRLRPKADYSLVFLSIDPQEGPADAAEAFRRDLAQNPVEGAAEGWRFVTASPQAIRAVSDAVGYDSRFDAALKQFLHPAGVVVLTPSGQVSSYLLGVTFQPGAVQDAVRRAASGEVGQVASPVLLLCFHYDPVTGQYTLAIMKVLRVMAVIAVVTLAGLWLLLRRGARAA